MSTRIRILSEQLANKIAAGEVVERPASVVKELLENALDAGASEILVELDEGGKRLIRVTDDGCGMSREDALLALERHATSKLTEAAGLAAISTLGFRGEAVPAIASVSRFTLATREAAVTEGTEIYLEGGRVNLVRSCGMAPGTVVTVRNLFFNTPARLKFLKSTATEAGHVADLVTRIALSRPDLRMILRSDGRTVVRVTANDPRERLVALLGRQVAEQCHPLAWQDDYITVTGLLGAPAVARATGSHLFAFVNGRFVRDKVVQHAINAAYRSVLERGRYPVVVLHLEIEPGEVDVNVHPAKHEVRFRNQQRVHAAIEAAVSGLLRQTPWLPGTSMPPVMPAAADDRLAGVREALQAYRPARPTEHLFTARGGALSAAATEPLVQQAVSPVQEAVPEGSGYYASLQYLGQFAGQYLVCAGEGELVLIDQHAAHERVAFERLRRQLATGRLTAQALLFPEPLEFSHSEHAQLASRAGLLQRFGFSIEPFGGTTWVVKEIPACLAAGAYRQALKDAIAELAELEVESSLTGAAEELLSRLACHSVVRGVHRLTPPEVAALFAQLDATDFAVACPHGRPLLARLPLRELEHLFHRG